MTTFKWISARENFLLRVTSDGFFEPHSDLVARVTTPGVDARLVVMAGTTRLRRARPGRARASLLRPLLSGLSISLRDKDDLYLAAIHADGAPRVGLTRVWLRLKGRLTAPLSYDKSSKVRT